MRRHQRMHQNFTDGWGGPCSSKEKLVPGTFQARNHDNCSVLLVVVWLRWSQHCHPSRDPKPLQSLSGVQIPVTGGFAANRIEALSINSDFDTSFTLADDPPKFCAKNSRNEHLSTLACEMSLTGLSLGSATSYCFACHGKLRAANAKDDVKISTALDFHRAVLFGRSMMTWSSSCLRLMSQACPA